MGAKALTRFVAGAGIVCATIFGGPAAQARQPDPAVVN